MGANGTATSDLVQGLLNGQIPDQVDPSVHGEYAETVQAMLTAFDSNGVEGARATFSALTKTVDGLAQLVAGNSAPVKTGWTADELLRMDFPEPPWAVSGLVPVGLSNLAGRPKVGKSWLALQLAIAVDSGGRFLGQSVEQGTVLVLALEDSARRLKDRLIRQGAPADVKIEFETAWPFLGEGGLAALQERLRVTNYRAVIIDTFSRAVGKADQMDGSEMTLLLGELQQLALSHDLAILLIDHHRKSSGFSSDPIDDLLGSTAKSAVLDAALGLYREQGKQGATLKIVGREVEEREVALEWDAQFCCWQALGDAGDVREDSSRGEVLSAITDLERLGELATTARIASHTSRDRGNISHILANLLADGKIRKGSKQGRQQPYEAV